MKRLIKIFILVFFVLCVERLYHRATDGFALFNIYAPPGDNIRWKRLDSPNAVLLNQTYRYFNCGSQSYAFISEDGKTVLKLFKFQHMRSPFFLNSFPSVGKLRTKRKKKRKILEKTFDSCLVAYDYFREETGLLFIHLAKTDHLQHTLTVIDKIGRRHILDLDQVEFVLQKRGRLVYDTLTQWMKEGERQKAEQGIRDLLHLVVKRCRIGIFDKDPDFRTNFGFIDETPFQIDFGRFSLSDTEKDPEIYRPEMVRITREFEKWIEENHSDLLDFFKKALNEIVSQ